MCFAILSHRLNFTHRSLSPTLVHKRIHSLVEQAGATASLQPWLGCRAERQKETDSRACTTEQQLLHNTTRLK